MRRFAGYRRPDGRVGIRNHVVILSVSGLTTATAQAIAARLPGTVPVVTLAGSGHLPEDAALHRRQLLGLAGHPNVAAALVLAADPAKAEYFRDALARGGMPVEALSLIEVGQDALALADRGLRLATRLVHRASRLERSPAGLGELRLALECGCSDTSSGIAANPLVGRIAEAVVAAGGSAMFGETVEWTGAEQVLAARARTPALGRAIIAAVQEREQLAHAAGADLRRENPGPQNIRGGLTTIEEKSLGAIAKGGRLPIESLLGPAEAPAGPGLHLMRTAFFSPESITVMVAAGAQLVLFTTGQGNSYCDRIAPTVKVCANPATCARLAEQIDLDAAALFEGRIGVDAALEAALDEITAIASGALTYGEIVGEGQIALARLAPLL